MIAGFLVLLLVIVISVASSADPGTTPPHLTAPKGLILVPTGLYRRRENVTIVEVINLQDPRPQQCQGLESFPVNVTHGYGGFVDGIPMICDFDLDVNQDCYTFGNTTPLLKANISRDHAACIVISVNNINVLWITGGITGVRYTNTSVYISPKTGVSVGPELPTAMFWHCMLRLNSSTAMIIGGVAGDEYTRATNHTRFYHSESSDWTGGPDLRFARSTHACGLISDSLSNKKIVIATTGILDYSNSTDLWSVGSSQWIDGPEFPGGDIYKATGTTSSDGKHFILIGGIDFRSGSGFQHSIYKLQCFNLICNWEKMKQKLHVARGYHFVILIPDNYDVNCTAIE